MTLVEIFGDNMTITLSYRHHPHPHPPHPHLTLSDTDEEGFEEGETNVPERWAWRGGDGDGDGGDDDGDGGGGDGGCSDGGEGKLRSHFVVARKYVYFITIMSSLSLPEYFTAMVLLATSYVVMVRRGG